LILTLGAMFAMVGSAAWIFSKQAWEQAEQEDPQKVFAQEVMHAVRARLPWVATNGAGQGSMSSKVWNRIRRSKEHSNTDL
jgi:hypothetical protein